MNLRHFAARRPACVLAVKLVLGVVSASDGRFAVADVGDDGHISGMFLSFIAVSDAGRQPAPSEVAVTLAAFLHSGLGSDGGAGARLRVTCSPVNMP